MAHVVRKLRRISCKKSAMLVLKGQNSFQRGKLACDWTEKTADGKVPSFRWEEFLLELHQTSMYHRV